ncbi:MAG: hypothetical protein IKV76_06040 [Clostridia bacterium]|nr:hypothetical protein [Clostridia bacterium]
MKHFGFFEGMKYGKCEEKFDKYKEYRNDLPKTTILNYLKSLPISAVCPMTTVDIFDNQLIEQAGIIIDGNFIFPVDFIHYYEKYCIGIPTEYEDYVKTILDKKETFSGGI